MSSPSIRSSCAAESCLQVVSFLYVPLASSTEITSQLSPSSLTTSSPCPLAYSTPRTRDCSPLCTTPWRRRSRSPPHCGTWPGTWTALAVGARIRRRLLASTPVNPSTRSLMSVSPDGSPPWTKRTRSGLATSGAGCCALRHGDSRKRWHPPCLIPPSPGVERERGGWTSARRCSSSAVL